MANQLQVQEAFQLIERLAGLCATEGVSDSTKTSANTMISSLLDRIVKPAVDKLKTEALGITT